MIVIFRQRPYANNTTCRPPVSLARLHQLTGHAAVGGQRADRALPACRGRLVQGRSSSPLPALRAWRMGGRPGRHHGRRVPDRVRAQRWSRPRLYRPSRRVRAIPPTFRLPIADVDQTTLLTPTWAFALHPAPCRFQHAHAGAHVSADDRVAAVSLACGRTTYCFFCLLRKTRTSTCGVKGNKSQIHPSGHNLLGKPPIRPWEAAALGAGE